MRRVARQAPESSETVPQLPTRAELAALQKRLAAEEGEGEAAVFVVGVAGEELGILGRIGECRECVRHPCLMARVIRDLQHAARRVRHGGPVDIDRSPERTRVQEAGAGEARQNAIVTRKVGLYYTGGHPRCAAGGSAIAIQDFHAPTSRRETLGDRRSRESRADDERIAFRPLDAGRRRMPYRPAGRKVPGQHLALASIAYPFLDREAGRRECVAHHSRGGIRGKRRAGSGKTCKSLHDRR